MGGSSAPQPQIIHPGEAAQAAMGTASAGEMMSIANQPVEQYANLYTASQLGPAETQAQQALANQAAYSSAQAQQDIQSRLDPQAYAQRQMRMQAANQRLGQLYGQDPTAFNFRAPGAYTVPGTSSVPSLANLASGSGAIAQNLAIGNLNKAGTDPSLTLPNPAANVPPVTQPQTYLS